LKDAKNWYGDVDTLIEELRKAPSHWGQFPEIPGYDQVVEIRRGGQGVVYRARQSSTSRTVAIKVLLEGLFASEASRHRFRREIEAVGRLRHPNIVRIIESGVANDGRLYYVMDFVDGVPIDDPAAPLNGDLKEKLMLFRKICRAVHHAHRHGVIHRDLKPGNILIDGNGSPHILDFGLAKSASVWSVDSPEATSVSHTGQFLGSLAWASPEQIEKSPDRIDLRTDVYSLGVILYQLVTGRLPHPVSKNLRQTLDAIASAAPPRPRAIRGDIPDDVETMILRCLAKEPGRRYQGAGELGRDVERYLRGEPIDAKRDRKWYVFRKTLARHKAITALATSLLVLIIGFSIFMTISYKRALRAEQEAVAHLAEAVNQKTKAIAVQDFLSGVLALTDPCVSSEHSVALRAMLESAERGIATRFGDHPEVEAEIRYVIGDVYFHIGRFEAAVENHVKALELFESAHGGNHPDVAKALCNLAYLRIQRGRLDEAEPMIERAHAIYTDRFGADHEKTAESLRYLGDLRVAQQRYDEAQAHFSRACEVYDERIAAHDLRMLKVLYHWSNLLIVRREFEEAQEKIDRIRAITRAHPDVSRWAQAVVFLNEGKIHLARGEFESAQGSFQETIDSALEIFGEEHTFLADIYNYMGHTLYYMQRYTEAEDWFGKGLEIFEATDGPESLGCGACLAFIAHARWMQGDLEAAEAKLRQAIPIYRQVYGSDSRTLAYYLLNLGQLLRDREKHDEALPFFEEGHRIRTAAVGEDHVIAAQSNALLGQCLVNLGRFEEAEKILLSALEVLASNEDTRYIPLALSSLVQLYEAWNKPEEAMKYETRLSARQTGE
jgi:serine/threonine protein kinase/predicted negative regulator of RcsB-dependent stress response